MAYNKDRQHKKKMVDSLKGWKRKSGGRKGYFKDYVFLLLTEKIEELLSFKQEVKK